MIDICKRVKRHYFAVEPLFSSLQSAWEAAKDKGEATFTADNITLPVNKAGMFRGGHKVNFCLHEDEIKYFYGTIAKTPEWLGRGEMARKIRRDPPIISSLYDALQTAWEAAKKNGEANFTAQGITFTTDKAGMFKGQTSNIFCLHESTIEQLQGLPQKPDEWIGINDMAARAHKSPNVISQLYKSLQFEWEKAVKTGATDFTAEGITIPTEKAGIFKERGHESFFCLHEDALKFFISPQKTPEWLGRGDMAGKTKRDPRKISSLYDAFTACLGRGKEKWRSYFCGTGNRYSY